MRDPDDPLAAPQTKNNKQKTTAAKDAASVPALQLRNNCADPSITTFVVYAKLRLKLLLQYVRFPLHSRKN